MSIAVPQRATLTRDLLIGFSAKRGADELANLVDGPTILDLRTDGDAYMVAATVDYTPQILSKHAADVLTGLVRDGYLLPRDRSCFEVMVLPATKGNPTKGIAPDPGAIAIVRNQPSEYRLAGEAAKKARAELLDNAQAVASVTVPAYRRAIAEAQIAERFSMDATDAQIDAAVSIEG